MTGDVHVISTIGSTMREQGLGVAELRRRLAARGISVSRGALDRLVSDRPLKSVNFDLLLPVLDELGITLGDPFVAIPAGDLARTQEAIDRARSATRALANGAHPAQLAQMLDEADQNDAATIDRLEQRLRREHPEAFDNRGRLRKRALSKALVAQFGGRRLSREQVDDVIAAGREATTRRRAAG
ncbi:MAG: helix-turn-helix domain-containing protein [Chloroflexi bacterium]|nr:helix-turn-helix domain-containing protein [Chloroflexota bacterium]